MSAAERTLYTLLSDTESVDYLARQHFFSDDSLAVVPDPTGRKITKWCVDQYFRSGRRRAPSREAIMECWEDEIEAAEIDLGDGTEADDIALVVDQLKVRHLVSRSQTVFRESMTKITQADPTEKIAAVGDVAAEWYRLARQVASKDKTQDAEQGWEEALQRYIARSQGNETTEGMTFGLRALDEHLHGVHPGEVCVWAAETGIGKSWVAARTAWHEFRQGRNVVLFTLENDLPMTFDRIICMAAKVGYERWQHGRATPEEEARVDKKFTQVAAASNTLVVKMPPRGERTAASMIREATALGAQTVIIDQLTFIETEDRHQKTSDAILEVMHDLKELVSEGAEKLALMLLHQINREGGDYVSKHGVYLAKHMAYGSEVERTADFLIAIYQSEMHRRVEDAEFQLIKSRRTKKARWHATFRVGDGDVRIQHRILEEGETPGDRPAEQAPTPEMAAA